MIKSNTFRAGTWNIPVPIYEPIGQRKIANRSYQGDGIDVLANSNCPAGSNLAGSGPTSRGPAFIWRRKAESVWWQPLPAKKPLPVCKPPRNLPTARCFGSTCLVPCYSMCMTARAKNSRVVNSILSVRWPDNQDAVSMARDGYENQNCRVIVFDEMLGKAEIVLFVD